ncbi:hypothetical protein cyc_08027 [Cyclospora cayetanensis]|uniref:Clu domain-containing protein n=1 Tax=Cyclospora cayetanensis TaxID=88456 RepID=A0A1D3D2K1_9EIME|nr:hypothetical protein cyc_08027 [Cyclospora cayetanensis]
MLSQGGIIGIADADHRRSPSPADAKGGKLGLDYGVDNELQQLVNEFVGGSSGVPLASKNEPYTGQPTPGASEGAPTVLKKEPAAPSLLQGALSPCLGDSESVVSEMIYRLKESLSAQAERWWRISMAKAISRPLLASYETNSAGNFSSTSQIQNDLVPGPNDKSIFSSNWHDRLQWAFQQVRTLSESQDLEVAHKLRRRLFERELALSHEIGSFAAAARAAAVVLLHSLPLGERASYAQPFQPASCTDRAYKGPFQCFVRITPEDHPTMWKVYQPKFAGDEVYAFDSLVLTVIVGDPQANVKAYVAREIYQNDVKGRQAMADAVYATCLARKTQTDLSLHSWSQLRNSKRRDLSLQVDTVWNVHDQSKFERAKLGLPIACLVDYAGLTVMVEPLIPLSPAPNNVLEELVSEITQCLPDFVRQCNSIGNPLACFDALDKVDRVTYNKFKNIARFLNLADYPFARGASDFDLALPPPALWRSQVDQFCIFRNLHETLPPKCVDGRVVPEQRFRQSFVSCVFDVALPCTSREQHKASETESSKFAQRHTTLRGSLEALSMAVHSMELSIRQDLIPVINAFQKNFLDSFDIAHTLHAHGINIRNVAQLLSHGPASPFRDAVVREVVARSAKRLFRMQVEKLFSGRVETSHIEELQRLVVKLFNLVLSTNEESRIFWQHQILPLALERYKVDLTESASPDKVCTFSLFKAMEYNFGVQFDSRVAVRSTKASNEVLLSLRLPLSVVDLSTFSACDSLLFPHISYVRAALLGSGHAETAEEKDIADWRTQLRSTKRRMRHFLEADEAEKAKDEDSKLPKTPGTLKELQSFAELRAVRGFYPRLHLVAPDTFALMQAAAASAEAGASRVSLSVLLDNMKAGLVVPASSEQIWGSANFALHGTCGAIRSALMGTGYPCHPYCHLVDEDENMFPVVTEAADEKHSRAPLRQCRKYKRKKLSLTLALLLKSAIGDDIFLLGKILQQTAYVMLQHNEVKAAAGIADYIYSRIPDGLSLQAEALLIDMQCTTKGTQPKDALVCYRHLKPILIAIEGKMSLRLLLADLLLASVAFKNKRFSAAIVHAFRVHKISTVCFDTGGAHWAAIAALRLVGAYQVYRDQTLRRSGDAAEVMPASDSARSMLEVQRSSEAIIILQHAVRAASTNPELPCVVTHMSRFWLATAFARLGRLENASTEAEIMLAGLESQLGTNHEATMSALYLAAEVKMSIGCLALQNPPLKIAGSASAHRDEKADAIGAPDELQEPLLWKPLSAEDFAIYEEIFRDKGMIQARADAEQLFLALFRRLLFREDNVLIEVHQPRGLDRKQRLRQIISTLRQLLKLKLCSLPISVLRLLAHRVYIACVAQGCSPALRPFGLMEYELGYTENSDEEDPEPCEKQTEYSHFAADRTRVYFKHYPRLNFGHRRTAAVSNRLKPVPDEAPHEKMTYEEPADIADYPFSFYSQQKVSGTERHRAQSSGVLYARVDGSSSLRPTQEHDDLMMQLLLFCEGPPSLNGILKSCYMSCLEDRKKSPSNWMDDLISDILSERGSLQHLRFLVCMMRHFFTLSQKALMISLAPGDFNRKRQAQILIQAMRGQQVEEEVSRKLILKRMINRSREQMPESTDDYFEYEINSPRQFDLMVGITRCDELVNATTWTGDSDLVEYTGSDDDLVAGRGDSANYRRSEIAAVEEHYLKKPTMGKGSISGKTPWRSMSTAARLSQQRFGGSNQLTANASPIAYGVMRNILKTQVDSELEAFGCIECLQPADKVPFLGG